jgi:hypothetical protein
MLSSLRNVPAWMIGMWSRDLQPGGGHWGIYNVMCRMSWMLINWFFSRFDFVLHTYLFKYIRAGKLLKLKLVGNAASGWRRARNYKYVLPKRSHLYNIIVPVLSFQSSLLRILCNPSPPISNLRHGCTGCPQPSSLWGGMGSECFTWSAPTEPLTHSPSLDRRSALD